MTDFQIGIIGIILGGALSWLISLFFFKKTVNKRLSVFVQFSSAVLGGVDDPTVKSELEIRYRGNKVDDLFQLQFAVANEGERAIRDVIEPLSLILPSGTKLLDGGVIHVEPDGRTVTLRSVDQPDGGTRLEFPFSVLNKEDFFIVKLLLNGEVDIADLGFRIAVDDLPPIIRPQFHTFTSQDEESRAGALSASIMLLALSVSNTVGLVWLAGLEPSLVPLGNQFVWLSPTTPLIALWIAGIVFWTVRGLSLLIRGVATRRERFVLPRREPVSELARLYNLRLEDEISPDLTGLFRPDYADYERHLARQLLRLSDKRRRSVHRDRQQEPQENDEPPPG